MRYLVEEAGCSPVLPTDRGVTPYVPKLFFFFCFFTCAPCPFSLPLILSLSYSLIISLSLSLSLSFSLAIFRCLYLCVSTTLYLLPPLGFYHSTMLTD